MENKERLDSQRDHWNRMLEKSKEMFGEDPSFSAIKSAEIYKENGVKTILELGAGQGRDTFYFVKEGFTVHVLDYSEEGLADIRAKAKELGVEDRIKCNLVDLRKEIALEDESFDACYSHMLYCMAFTKDELKNLTNEVKRVLKTGGIQAYTSRNTRDQDYAKGDHLGDNLYVDGGFIIEFIDEDMIKDYSEGFEIIENTEFEEGGLPRILSLVIQKKL